MTTRLRFIVFRSVHFGIAKLKTVEMSITNVYNLMTRCDLVNKLDSVNIRSQCQYSFFSTRPLLIFISPLPLLLSYRMVPVITSILAFSPLTFTILRTSIPVIANSSKYISLMYLVILFIHSDDVTML